MLLTEPLWRVSQATLCQQKIPIRRRNAKTPAASMRTVRSILTVGLIANVDQDLEEKLPIFNAKVCLPFDRKLASPETNFSSLLLFRIPYLSD